MSLPIKPTSSLISEDDFVYILILYIFIPRVMEKAVLLHVCAYVSNICLGVCICIQHINKYANL